MTIQLSEGDMRGIGLAAAAGLLAAGAAHGEVVDATANGFQVRQSVTVSAPPEKAYAALIQVQRWWDGAHSYSGKASNIKIDARPGGCWCETTEGGHVRHMEVVYVAKNKEVRYFGGLGPLQMTGATGHLQMTVAPKDGGSVVTWTYNVGGYVKGGAGQFAAPVDEVMTAGIGRFKKYVETGSPT